MTTGKTDRQAWQARYLTHRQVQIAPAIPVPLWSLSPIGAARVDQLVDNLGSLKGTTRVISREETKALETAEPIAVAPGIAVEARPQMRENDRSATGFLVLDEFERVADAFFAIPQRSVCGWERAVDAQKRIANEANTCLASHKSGDILFVGHDGGCWFEFDSDGGLPTGWKPMEALLGD